MKKLGFALSLMFCLSWVILRFPSGVGAQEASFYKGQTITIVVGSTAGGFYDRWARLFARYMGKYIPGQPDFVAQNMPGAGRFKINCALALKSPKA